MTLLLCVVAVPLLYCWTMKTKDNFSILTSEFHRYYLHTCTSYVQVFQELQGKITTTMKKNHQKCWKDISQHDMLRGMSRSPGLNRILRTKGYLETSNPVFPHKFRARWKHRVDSSELSDIWLVIRLFKTFFSQIQ